MPTGSITEPAGGCRLPLLRRLPSPHLLLQAGRRVLLLQLLRVQLLRLRLLLRLKNRFLAALNHPLGPRLRRRRLNRRPSRGALLPWLPGRLLMELLLRRRRLLIKFLLRARLQLLLRVLSSWLQLLLLLRVRLHCLAPTLQCRLVVRRLGLLKN